MPRILRAGDELPPGDAMSTITDNVLSRAAAHAAGQTLDLVSLHVPKAFGTSLCEVLIGHYGRHRIAGDYETFLEDDRSAIGRMKRPALSPATTVVHGHFPAVRYAGVPARRRIAFLREPIRRTLSHYLFWVHEPKHGNPVHDRVLDERLGLLDFAALPQIRRFHAETIFGGCDTSSFDLIGVVENLDRDWPRFQRLTGIRAPLPHLNRNGFPGYAEIVAKVLDDQALMRVLRRVLEDDIRFYERFL